MGPSAGGSLDPTIKITNWNKVSTALVEIYTPFLNSIIDDINTPNEINSDIGALSNHVRTAVGKNMWELQAFLDHRKLPADVLELITAKNIALRHVRAYPTASIDPKREPYNNPTTHNAKGGLAFRRSDNFSALDDAEISECLPDNIESQCSHPSSPYDILHVHRIKKEVRYKASLKFKNDLHPVSLSEPVTLIKSFKTRKALGFDVSAIKLSNAFPCLYWACWSPYLTCSSRIAISPHMEKSGGQRWHTRLPFSLTPLQRHSMDSKLFRINFVEMPRTTTGAFEIQYFSEELPTIVKFMKDASKRFFNIAESYPNALLYLAVSNKPCIYYVFPDPPDVLTAAVESLMEVADSNG
ncbi:hypothetical protein EVAR_4933_1 [Eumeta japonica]|uniref:Uncharacterized protein n=1 Tax=Eumeta variegata TaxID=151549 RepID=A0A4C1UZ06_EUMVA|nr:hypothetical protein EVAR_4933_1 [Eumeta japonica]